MGRAARSQRHSPELLPEKLSAIRESLGLSQNQLVRALGSPEKIDQSSISSYERGVKEPPLLILLAYAKLIGSSTDNLIDDGLELPRTPKNRSG